ncbi:MAG: hypothetical protein ACI4GO_06415 [Hominenteromicrobium sp.]
MTGKDLFAALSFVRDEYVEEAETECPPRRVIPMKTVRWAGVLAACVCLLVGWAFAAQWMKAGSSMTTGATDSTAAVMEEGAMDGGEMTDSETAEAAGEEAGEGQAEDTEFTAGGSTVCGFGIEAAEVERVTVVSMPESAEHERTYTSPGKIQEIVSYLNGLTLRTDFPEDPDAYCGMAYKLTLTMADGTEREFTHFANMFLREGDGGWLRMTYEEASELDNIIRRIPSD